MIVCLHHGNLNDVLADKSSAHFQPRKHCAIYFLADNSLKDGIKSTRSRASNQSTSFTHTASVNLRAVAK